MQSTPNSQFTIELFGNATNDASGRDYLGSTSVQTNAAGVADFSITASQLPAGVQYFTATATSLANNTSEFSNSLNFSNPLSAPTNFTATPVSPTQLSLTWGAATGAGGYELYQWISGQPTLIGTYGAGATSAQVTGLTPSSTYAFDLRAFGGGSVVATPWISGHNSGVRRADDIYRDRDFGFTDSSKLVGSNWGDGLQPV